MTQEEWEWEVSRKSANERRTAVIGVSTAVFLILAAVVTVWLTASFFFNSIGTEIKGGDETTLMNDMTSIASSVPDGQRQWKVTESTDPKPAKSGCLPVDTWCHQLTRDWLVTGPVDKEAVLSRLPFPMEQQEVGRYTGGTHHIFVNLYFSEREDGTHVIMNIED